MLNQKRVEFVGQVPAAVLISVPRGGVQGLDRRVAIVRLLENNTPFIVDRCYMVNNLVTPIRKVFEFAINLLQSFSAFLFGMRHLSDFPPSAWNGH